MGRERNNLRVIIPVDLNGLLTQGVWQIGLLINLARGIINQLAQNGALGFVFGPKANLTAKALT